MKKKEKQPRADSPWAHLYVIHMDEAVTCRAFACVTLRAKGFTNSVLWVILRGAPLRQADSTISTVSGVGEKEQLLRSQN